MSVGYLDLELIIRLLSHHCLGMSFSFGFKAYAVIPKVSLMIGEEGKFAEFAVIEEAISAVSFGHHLH